MAKYLTYKGFIINWYDFLEYFKYVINCRKHKKDNWGKPVKFSEYITWTETSDHKRFPL